MTTFKIKFKACKRGAIGKPQNFTETVKADTEEIAILSLYERYDHLQQIKVKQSKPATI